MHIGSFRLNVQHHSFSTHRQSIVSSTTREIKNKKLGQVAYLAKWEHDKAFKNCICALAEEKDYAFCKACHKLVKVMVSGWYVIVRCCQSDVHLRAVTKRMLHVLINLHMSCKHSFPMVLGQTLWSPMLNTVRSFKCLTGLQLCCQYTDRHLLLSEHSGNTGTRIQSVTAKHS